MPLIYSYSVFLQDFQNYTLPFLNREFAVRDINCLSLQLLLCAESYLSIVVSVQKGYKRGRLCQSHSSLWYVTVLGISMN